MYCNKSDKSRGVIGGPEDSALRLNAMRNPQIHTDSELSPRECPPVKKQKAPQAFKQKHDLIHKLNGWNTWGPGRVPVP